MEREAVKKLSKKLDIVGYIEACSQMQLTINDWLGLYSDPFYSKFGLPDLVKEALKLEARLLNAEIKKKRDEEMSKLKMQTQNLNAGMKSMQSTNIDKYFK